MKHWRTALAGLATAVLLPVLDLIQKGETDRKTIVISSAIALIGWLCKDALAKEDHSKP